MPKPSYKMSSIPRGKCHILQNDKFSDRSLDRVGCNDAQRLAETFARLDFEVTKDLNLTALQMFERIKTFSAADHSKYDCFVLCISSHGGPNTILGADQKNLEVHHIISRFAGRRCESLIGKPKLFFISACRNDVSNGSQRLGNDKSSDGGGSIGHISSNELERGSPKAIGLADIFEGYSTPYGMV